MRYEHNSSGQCDQGKARGHIKDDPGVTRTWATVWVLPDVQESDPPLARVQGSWAGSGFRGRMPASGIHADASEDRTFRKGGR